MTRTRRLADVGRLMALVAILICYSLHGLAAPMGESGAVASAPSWDGELMRWMVTQGGLTVALIVVLWSYRRDFTRVLAAAQADNERLIAALHEVTVATTAQTTTLLQQQAAMADMTRAVQDCRAVQRLLEREP